MDEQAKSSQAVEPEIRISPVWIVIGLIAIAVGLFLCGEALGPGLRARAHTFALGLGVAACVTWVLYGWRPTLGRWFVVVALVLLVHVGSVFLAVPGLLALLVVPVIAAFALLGPLAAALVVATETVVALVPVPAVVPLMERSVFGVYVAGAWMVVGVLFATDRQVHEAVVWSSAYVMRARELLEQARDRKAELAQALEDLAQANRQLALANERTAALRLAAEEAQKAKTDFVARVSHEFRTPLNMIIGLVSLMIETPERYSEDLAPDIQEDLAIVHRNCEHLSSMIDDVLDLTRVEAGRLTLHRELVDLAGVISGALVVVRPLLERKGLYLQVDVPSDLPQVYCDRVRIRQVVLNLVSNAARFTTEGGITVRVVRQAQDVVIGVTDTGPGIPAENVQRMFEPFYQVPDARQGRSGSGLGLSICKQCVELHGGRIWLESQVGAGTTFFVQLPILPAEQKAALPSQWIREDWLWHEQAFRGAQAAATEKLTRPRVLVCDESGVLYPQLTRYSDAVEFVDTRDVSQVLDQLQQCPAHAVLANVASPQELGPLIDEAKRLIPLTPVIACSVPSPTQRAVASGARGYLTKPVNRAGLEGAIRAAGGAVKRVLLVDDDRELLQLLTRTLLACDGTLQVDVAASGKEALEALGKVLPDLVLLDVVLPDLSGWQVLEAMKQDERTSGVPTFIVSAQDPAERASASQFLHVWIDGGLSISKLLGCSLQVSSLLLAPDSRPDQARR